MNELLNIREKNFSIIGLNCLMKGEFHLEGLVRISSEIHGTIMVKEGGQVIVEKEGKIEGQIHCEDIEIHGVFDGEINSSGKLIIFPSAKVSGKIHSNSLVIYPGSEVNITGHAEVHKH